MKLLGENNSQKMLGKNTYDRAGKVLVNKDDTSG